MTTLSGGRIRKNEKLKRLSVSLHSWSRSPLGLPFVRAADTTLQPSPCLILYSIDKTLNIIRLGDYWRPFTIRSRVARGGLVDNTFIHFFCKTIGLPPRAWDESKHFTQLFASGLSRVTRFVGEAGATLQPFLSYGEAAFPSLFFPICPAVRRQSQRRCLYTVTLPGLAKHKK